MERRVTHNAAVQFLVPAACAAVTGSQRPTLRAKLYADAFVAVLVDSIGPAE